MCTTAASRPARYSITTNGTTARRPGFEVTAGTIRYLGQDLVSISPEQRALLGVFLAFQYPVEIPGVSNMEFLKAALDAKHKSHGQPPLSTADFIRRTREKRNEILQLLLLEPRLAVLDETDSGLDIDALSTVAAGINRFRGSGRGILLVTHYQRLLNHIKPDRVHVLADGRIVKSGDHRLALELDERGYGWVTDAA